MPYELFPKTAIITVQNIPMTILNLDQREYISLTDMAKARTDSSRAADVIKNSLRARSTLEFLGTWEILYNPDFKVVEFDHFKIWVIKNLPCSQKFQRGTGTQRVFDHICGSGGICAGLCHIGQTDVFPLIQVENCHGDVLDSYNCGFWEQLIRHYL